MKNNFAIDFEKMCQKSHSSIEEEDISYKVYIDGVWLFTLHQTCPCCPETYELKSRLIEKPLANMRLRCSKFTCDFLYPNCETIYTEIIDDVIQWRGMFRNEEERTNYLGIACSKVIDKMMGRENGDD